MMADEDRLEDVATPELWKYHARLVQLVLFPEEKKDVSMYLCQDKDFIALAKKSIQIMRYIFFLFLEENICCRYLFKALR